MFDITFTTYNIGLVYHGTHDTTDQIPKKKFKRMTRHYLLYFIILPAMTLFSCLPSIGSTKIGKNLKS